MDTKKNDISKIYGTPEYVIQTSYTHLTQGNLDIGFASQIENGKDHHKVTRELTLSIQKFHNGHLSNMVFANGQAIRIELSDPEIIPYYSDYIELRYVLSGHLEIEIEGENVQFKENDICFINSSAYHSESLKTSDCIIVNISIDQLFFTQGFIDSISLTPLQKFLRTNILQRGHVEKYLRFTPVSNDSDELNECTSALILEIRLQKPGWLNISRGYIIRMMDMLSTGYQYNFSESDHERYYDSLFASIDDFMKNNLSTMTMNDLVKKFHFHSNFFNNLIKKYTGMTYSNYLILLRIDKAKTLLRETNLTVDEIILYVGYHNKGFFYKRFQEQTGLSPSKYRSTKKRL